MSDAWGMISAIVAAATFLPLLFSQPCQQQISKSMRYVGSSIFPAKARCETATWSMVRDGPLHACQSMFCAHSVQGHRKQKECWKFITEWLLSGVRQRQGQPEYVEKPEALDLFGGTYLCIDVRVFLALLLCSAGDRKLLSWREGAASYDDDLILTLRPIGPNKDVLLAHIHGRLKQERVQYTKIELTNLMNGYPPWYRERVICSHGPSVPSPIRSDSDITRGGWVIAVGLVDLIKWKPMALYTVPNLADEQTDGTYYSRTNGEHLRLAVKRVHDVLENLAQQITNDANLKAVTRAIHYMIVTHTGSGVEKYLSGGVVSGGSISQLNATQCMFAMTLFNGLVPSDADVQTLRPILAPVLQAAFSGCYEVIQYLKDTGMRLVLPYGLGSSLSRKIYLRDCVVDED